MLNLILERELKKIKEKNVIFLKFDSVAVFSFLLYIATKDPILKVVYQNGKNFLIH